MSATDSTTEQTTTNPLIELTGFQRDLLLAIEDVEENGSTREKAELYDYPEPTGQCIKRKVEQYGHGTINHGRLYPNLDTLVEAGLVEKKEVDRRTNGYTLTSKGETQLERFRAFVGE